jgi:hypothetical protein
MIADTFPSERLMKDRDVLNWRYVQYHLGFFTILSHARGNASRAVSPAALSMRDVPVAQVFRYHTQLPACRWQREDQ